MSTKQNKVVVRQVLEEAWGNGNLAVIDELLDANYTSHYAPPVVPPGPEGVKQYITLFRTALPDLHAKIDDAIAEGDKVVTR